MSRLPLLVRPEPDEPEFASTWLDVSVAGREYPMLLDTGAARTRVPADDLTGALPVVGIDETSAAFGGRTAQHLVVVSDVALGSAHLGSVEVARGTGSAPGLLGMDVLRRFRCHLELAAAVLTLDEPGPVEPARAIQLDARGHVYVDVDVDGLEVSGCVDTGASATVVDRNFWSGQRDRFEWMGDSTGEDATGDSATAPVVRLPPLVIGERFFPPHRAVVVDLSGLNTTLARPMDLILGFPTIRQAGWLFDFPAGLWSPTEPGQAS